VTHTHIILLILPLCPQYCLPLIYVLHNYGIISANPGMGINYTSYTMDVIFHNSSKQMFKQ